ncbi:hypothetical protein M8C21_024956 [Ambrosia artemisiifolia]|uniref:Uncharacterized protein n=1 Tax=Ambrosia artemisiifolia TaxID=4212 RepID=A0AAD5GEG4_AMBAR|nr:hypothetical protein M8C21_024956 [Ambrosia artemisiifolia]
MVRTEKYGHYLYTTIETYYHFIFSPSIAITLINQPPLNPPSTPTSAITSIHQTFHQPFTRCNANPFIVASVKPFCLCCCFSVSGSQIPFTRKQRQTVAVVCRLGLREAR